VSPLSLRRHRAERLLRDEFEALRGRVLAGARGRLRANGVGLDEGDLEACYAMAWQGLYTAVLEGQEIANPTGWLVLVTYRRALDDHRACTRAHCGNELRLDAPSAERPIAGGERETGRAIVDARAAALERDFAAELDDRARLRQLFEGLRGRLNEREREAATLCYLHGLSRAEAAARMGVSETRMRKLMEGRGPGRPGVAGKVGVLVRCISDGDWCAEQGSLMRALAYGILDPDGERYGLALTHHSHCPACRAYVASLRGLAATLPPVVLPWGLGAAALARAAESVHAGAAVSGAGASGGAVGVTGGAGASGSAAGISGGAAGAAGAAGAGGVAGGGWLFGAGSLGAKLAVGCVLALTVGAGCVALDGGHHARGRGHVDRRRSLSGAHAAGGVFTPYELSDLGRPAAAADVAGTTAPPLPPSTKAVREFGPEQALAAADAQSKTSVHAGAAAAERGESIARSASSGGAAGALVSGGGSSGGGGTGGALDPGSAVSGGSASADSAAAEREFSPG
jgi:DNA-directed RNA polymerase specialized sigma24 family protein